MRVALRAIHRGLGQCPVVSDPNYAANTMCTDGMGQEIPCSEMSVCDSLTGAVHYQYAIPGSTADPNLTVVDPGTGIVISAGVGSNLQVGQQVENPATGLPAGNITINPATGQYWNARQLPVPPVPVVPTVQSNPVPGPTRTTTTGTGPTGVLKPASTSGFNVSSLLEESTFGGMPNWVWLAGIAAVLLVVGKR